MSRTGNSVKNIASAIGGQMMNNLLRFACRTAFIYTLGEEYLGISSLYANILTLLSVSELGFASAITYSLYKPLAENNVPEVRALMGFFKNAYRIIGLVILGLGLALMPLLPKLMNGTTEAVNIYEYYLLYLAQTVVSYLFFAYKGTLLVADQKRYLVDTVSYVVQVVMNLVQIAILVVLRSFLLYTVISILSSMIQNMAAAWMADRRYPWLKEPAQPLSREKRREVFHQVYASSLYRICNVVGIATDNLIISANISVLMVGLYDNYSMIIQVIQRLLSGLLQAFTASLGNYYASESKQRNEFLFRCLNRMNDWIIVFCSVSFLMLLQPFIRLCFGDSFLLSDTVVVIIVLNFATNYMQGVVQTYKDASGMFIRGKYRAVATAVLNLGSSIWLVRRIGLPGVFLGSIISRMATTGWYDAWLLYRVGFEMSPRRYFFGCAALIGWILALGYGIQRLCNLAALTGWADLILRGAACVVIVNGVYLLVYGRSEECRFLLEKGLALIRKKRK